MWAMLCILKEMLENVPPPPGNQQQLVLKMLKTELEGPAKDAGLWLRNIQLGLFALPLSAAAMYINDWSQIREFGIMQGFDNVVVWLVVLLIGVGGLLVAATMKYADNIAKCFATAIAIVSGTLCSVPLFHFALTPIFSVGAMC